MFITFHEVENTDIDSIIGAAYGQSYVLSVNQIKKFPNSTLAAFCRNSKCVNGIYKYQCIDASYEEFNIIFRVICGMYVSMGEFRQHQQVLDFFGFGPEDILIDFLETEPLSLCSLPDLDGYSGDSTIIYTPSLGLGRSSCHTCSRLTELFDCSKCKKTQYCSRNCQIIHWNESHKHECGRDYTKPKEDFIICPTDERTTMVANLATELKKPFIRFRILFAEGVATFGGESSGSDPVILKMYPVWVSFGDYDNILLQSSLMTTSVSGDNIHESFIDGISGEYEKTYTDFLNTGNKRVYFGDEDRCDEDKYDDKNNALILCDAYNHQISFDLQIARDTNEILNLTELILGKRNQRSSIIPMHGIILPGDGCSRKYEYFHVDQSSKTCFDVAEAVRMCDYVKNTDFINRVKKQLNHIDFQLPQVIESNEHFFCNEEVYGTFNFVLVTGIVSPK